MNGVRMVIRDSGAIPVSAVVQVDASVGIQPEDADKVHRGGLTLGALALVHEFGLALLNIPARMWFRGWAATHAPAETRALRNALADMVRKQKFDAGPLQVIVQRMRATMVGRIAGGLIKPRNAPATLAKKAPENRPLVESQALMRAIQGKLDMRSSGGRGLQGTYKTGGG